MKYLFFKLIALLLIIFQYSCEERNFNETVGNDTFSCKINNKLFLPSGGTGKGGGSIRPFSWYYSNFDDPDEPLVFTISVGGDYRMRINAIAPKLGRNSLNKELVHSFETSNSGMIVKNEDVFFNTKDNQENGFVNFTELSKSKAVGTFECMLYDENGKELKVTNGKFNLSLNSSTH